MLKYDKFSVVFEEIPDKVTLAVSITNCQRRCKGCHSPHLRKDVGDPLTIDEIKNKLDIHIKNCNCFLFLGEGNDQETLLTLNRYIKDTYNIETAIYSGGDNVDKILFSEFDYVKVGSYQDSLGSLTSKTTNQRLYYKGVDITERFWKN